MKKKDLIRRAKKITVPYQTDSLEDSLVSENYYHDSKNFAFASVKQHPSLLPGGCSGKRQ